jgi:soluble lytic murein transglycosylase-like protein
MRFCLDYVVAVAVFSTLSAVAWAGEPASGTAPAALPPAVWVVKVDAHSGRLVRTLAVAPQATRNHASEVKALVAEAAKTFNVNPQLIDSVIQVESNYNPFAVSPKGAQGLMQLMPGTAQRFGVTDSFDPRQNIEAGVRYLKLLQNTFQDDRLAIAAYNAGEGAVAKYGDVPPYRETIDYVARVGEKLNTAKTSQAKADQAQAKAVPAKTNDETSTAVNASDEEPKHILGYVDTEGKLHIATR